MESFERILPCLLNLETGELVVIYEFPIGFLVFFGLDYQVDGAGDYLFSFVFNGSKGVLVAEDCLLRLINVDDAGA